MSVLYDVLACPRCQGTLVAQTAGVECAACRALFRSIAGVPAFLDRAPAEMDAAVKKNRRGGSAWRQANNGFFRAVASAVPPDSVVIDVGAGHSYLKDYFGPNYLATDIYPYEGLDFVCDLARQSPLKRESVDLILLNNVLEHLPEPRELLRAAAGSLRAGGMMAIAVPFIIKVHQAPYDFLRYTHFMLRRLLEQEAFRDIRIEAIYTPGALYRVFFHEKFAAYPSASFWQRVIARTARTLTWRMVRLTDYLLTPAASTAVDITHMPGQAIDPWVTGYHVLATKT